ncbi:MAG: hypothetical protein L0227_10290 [Chloroflexi bacterium]|nr:hypothetical protein [Chloroflexota bacterium]
MRRLAGFALGGLVAIWVIGFLPPSASTISLALVVGVGVAGGRLAAGPPELVALVVGAFLGAALGGLTRAAGVDGPSRDEVVTASLTIAITVGVAGFLSAFLNAARRPPPTARR